MSLKSLPNRKPKKASRKPKKASRKPVKKSRKPVKKSRKPKKASRKPKKASRKPVKKSRKPKKASRKPKKASRKPKKASRKPKRASRKPKKASRKPKKASRKPKKASRKPKKASRKPKKASLNPWIGASVGFQRLDASAEAVTVDENGKELLPFSATSYPGRPGQKIILGQSSFFADEPKQTSLKSKKSSLKSKKVGKKIKPRIKINESFIKRNTKDCQRVRFKKKALPWAVYIRNIIEKTDEWECYGSCITSNELCMTDKDCDKNEKCSKQTGDKYLHYDYYGHYCCKDKPPTYEDGLRFISEILEPGLEYNPPKQKDLDQFTKVIAWYKAYFQKEIRLGKSVSDKYL
jgi:hypothetical protein